MEPELEFVRVLGGSFQLGGSCSAFAGLGELSSSSVEWIDSRLSPIREATLPAFEIARTTLDAEALLGELSDESIDGIGGLADLCDLIDAALRPLDLRLASEDELEAACGSTLFGWGNEIPNGLPTQNKTEFLRHREPLENGLSLNADTYQVEITRTACKLGDGGEALCGGYEWPMAWLARSPRYRVPPELVDDLLFEFLEGARVRPVRL